MRFFICTLLAIIALGKTPDALPSGKEFLKSKEHAKTEVRHEIRVGTPLPPTNLKLSERAVGSSSTGNCKEIYLYDDPCPGFNPNAHSLSAGEVYDFVVDGVAFNNFVPWYQRGCFLYEYDESGNYRRFNLMKVDSFTMIETPCYYETTTVEEKAVGGGCPDLEIFAEYCPGFDPDTHRLSWGERYDFSINGKDYKDTYPYFQSGCFLVLWNDNASNKREHTWVNLMSLDSFEMTYTDCDYTSSQENQVGERAVGQGKCDSINQASDPCPGFNPEAHLFSASERYDFSVNGKDYKDTYPWYQSGCFLVLWDDNAEINDGKYHKWVNIKNLDSYTLTYTQCDYDAETQVGIPHGAAADETSVGDTKCDPVDQYGEYCPGFNPSSSQLIQAESYDFVINGVKYTNKYPWYQSGCFLSLYNSDAKNNKEHLWVNVQNLDSFTMTYSPCDNDDAKSTIGGSGCDLIDISDTYCPGFNPTSSHLKSSERYDFVVNHKFYENTYPWFQSGCFLILYDDNAGSTVGKEHPRISIMALESYKMVYTPCEYDVETQVALPRPPAATGTYEVIDSGLNKSLITVFAIIGVLVVIYTGAQSIYKKFASVDNSEFTRIQEEC